MPNLIKHLPLPNLGRMEWPWTEEVNGKVYDSFPELPKISVITISFNQNRFLEETIRSVLLQNYPNVEYIIVDGSSTDGSVDTIKKYKQWITYWISQRDKGPADALNYALKKCTGDFIYYLNSDDVLVKSGILSFIKQYNRNREYDVYAGHGVIINAQSEYIRKIYSNTWNLSIYLHGRCCVVQQATFIRRSKLNETNGFNTANSTCWDGELLVDLSNIGARFMKMNELIGGFRIHDMSITGSQSSSRKYAEDIERIRRTNGVYKINTYKAGFQAFLNDPIVLLKRFLSK